MGASSANQQPVRLPFLRVTTQLDADLWIYLKVVADPEEHEEGIARASTKAAIAPKRAIWP